MPQAGLCRGILDAFKDKQEYPLERISNAALFNEDARLVKKGIITVKEIEHPIRRKEALVRLDKEIMEELVPVPKLGNSVKKGQRLEKIVIK